MCERYIMLLLLAKIYNIFNSMDKMAALSLISVTLI